MLDKKISRSNKNRTLYRGKRIRKRKNIRAFAFLLVGVFFLTVAVYLNIWRQDYQLQNAEDTLIVDMPFQAPEFDASRASAFEESAPSLDNSVGITLPFDLTAHSVFLYDLDQDEIIYSKNAQEQTAPASLTKIMTAIVVMENIADYKNTMVTFRLDMNEELMEYGYALNDLATYSFEEGETVSILDALYILFLRSANDAANLLADYVGNGSIYAFVEMMNAKAQEIGAVNTHFTNPHGLDAPYHYTTAYDMFLITQYALSLPGFQEIAQTVHYQVPESNMREPVTIATVTSIHDPSKPAIYDETVTGIKTGYTDAAGRCLISIAQKNGRNLLMVLMKTPLEDDNGEKVSDFRFFEETSLLYEWAFRRDNTALSK